jgi:hypothetical protein
MFARVCHGLTVSGALIPIDAANCRSIDLLFGLCRSASTANVNKVARTTDDAASDTLAGIQLDNIAPNGDRR